jgi:phosphatidylglycerol:prolipoprotein diacylglycerol transferase
LHPVLFRLGPVSVYSFGLMLSLAFSLAVLVGFFNAKRHGLDSWVMIDMAAYLFLVGLIGSRLLFVAMNWQLYAAEPIRALFTWEGGVSFYGAVLGGLVVTFVFARRRRISMGRLADMLAPGLALAAGVGRIGCALNGCCYGLPTSGFWGVFTRFAPGLRHPTQLYEASAYIGIFIFLLLWQRRRSFAPGQLFLTFVSLYLGGRFIIESFREGERLYPWLTVTQAASLALGALTAVAYVLLGRRARTAALAAGTGGGDQERMPGAE